MYLVTGGAGFIGSHLVERLIKEQVKVRVLDNFETGTRENLRPFGGSVELVQGSILDYELLSKALQGVEIVFHQAALRSVPLSIENPLAYNKVNIQGTLNVLVASREAGVKKVIFASSSSVYGDSPKLPKVEDQTPAPISPYAVSKLAGEHYCSVFTKLYHLEAIALRYFNVFGPRQDPESEYAAVIPRFIKSALTDDSFEVHGDGLQSRDFTYVDDVVEANLLVAKSKNNNGSKGGIFNVARGESHSLLDLINILEKILKKRLRYVHTPARLGDVRQTSADISRLKTAFGYEPNVSFDAGLEKTVQYLIELTQKNSKRKAP